jgi:predicted kinase
MLFIFGGLPGTGKSTLTAALAHRRNAVYLRIDTIEQAVRDSGLSVNGPVGYVIGYQLASDNLRLGTSVVADSVNPIYITRKAWREVALQAKVPFVEIEIICSDPEEHRKRVESRPSDIPNLQLPTWKEVVERAYEPWDTEHLIIDTAGQSPDESISHLFAALENWGIKS